MDPISDLLTAIRVADYAFFDNTGSWDFAEEPGVHAYLGTISRGCVWLDIEGQRQRVAFAAGDCFLIMSGAAHRMRGNTGEPATITGVRLTFDDLNGTLLADLLPKVLHAHADQIHSAEMRTALELIASEAAAPAPGSEVAIQR